jgi:predicted Ser/Thr protein kinase
MTQDRTQPADGDMSRDEALGRLQEELERATAAGATLDHAELAARYGVGTTDVVRCLEALQAIDRALAEDLPDFAFDDGDPELPPPELPADYELIGELGRGGMGVVYRARQRSLDRTVAVKVLRPGEIMFGDAIRRFRKEAQHLARLRHRHVVTVYEVGEAGGNVYYTMDYHEGGSLEDLLRDGPLTPSRTAKLLRQVTSAIAFAHSEGIIHRDLKPANVLLDEHGEAIVADFGLARDLGVRGDITRTGRVIGTPAYMSPEQARGDGPRIGEPTDVYALGAILYQCLTGAPPFCGKPLPELLHAVIHDDPPAPRRRNPAVPRDLEVICRKALEKDPARRYTTARALLEDLERFEEGRPIRARPPSLTYRARRFVARRRASLMAALGTAVVLASLFVAWDATRDRTGELVPQAERLLAEGEPKAAALLLDDILEAAAWPVMAVGIDGRPADPEQEALYDRFAEARLRWATKLRADGATTGALDVLTATYDRLHAAYAQLSASDGDLDDPAWRRPYVRTDLGGSGGPSLRFSPFGLVLLELSSLHQELGKTSGLSTVLRGVVKGMAASGGELVAAYEHRRQEDLLLRAVIERALSNARSGREGGVRSAAQLVAGFGYELARADLERSGIGRLLEEENLGAAAIIEACVRTCAEPLADQDEQPSDFLVGFVHALHVTPSRVPLQDALAAIARDTRAAEHRRALALELVCLGADLPYWSERHGTGALPSDWEDALALWAACRDASRQDALRMRVEAMIARRQGAADDAAPMIDAWLAQRTAARVRRGDGTEGAPASADGWRAWLSEHGEESPTAWLARGLAIDPSVGLAEAFRALADADGLAPAEHHLMTLAAPAAAPVPLWRTGVPVAAGAGFRASRSHLHRPTWAWLRAAGDALDLTPYRLRFAWLDWYADSERPVVVGEGQREIRPGETVALDLSLTRTRVPIRGAVEVDRVPLKVDRSGTFREHARAEVRLLWSAGAPLADAQLAMRLGHSWSTFANAGVFARAGMVFGGLDGGMGRGLRTGDRYPDSYRPARAAATPLLVLEPASADARPWTAEDWQTRLEENLHTLVAGCTGTARPAAAVADAGTVAPRAFAALHRWTIEDLPAIGMTLPLPGAKGPLARLYPAAAGAGWTPRWSNFDAARVTRPARLLAGDAAAIDVKPSESVLDDQSRVQLKRLLLLGTDSPAIHAHAFDVSIPGAFRARLGRKAREGRMRIPARVRTSWEQESKRRWSGSWSRALTAAVQILYFLAPLTVLLLSLPIRLMPRGGTRVLVLVAATIAVHRLHIAGMRIPLEVIGPLWGAWLTHGLARGAAPRRGDLLAIGAFCLSAVAAVTAWSWTDEIRVLAPLRFTPDQLAVGLVAAGAVTVVLGPLTRASLARIWPSLREVDAAGRPAGWESAPTRPLPPAAAAGPANETAGLPGVPAPAPERTPFRRTPLPAPKGLPWRPALKAGAAGAALLGLERLVTFLSLLPWWGEGARRGLFSMLEWGQPYLHIAMGLALAAGLLAVGRAARARLATLAGAALVVALVVEVGSMALPYQFASLLEAQVIGALQLAPRMLAFLLAGLAVRRTRNLWGRWAGTLALFLISVSVFDLVTNPLYLLATALFGEHGQLDLDPATWLVVGALLIFEVLRVAGLALLALWARATRQHRAERPRAAQRREVGFRVAPFWPREGTCFQ